MSKTSAPAAQAELKANIDEARRRSAANAAKCRAQLAALAVDKPAPHPFAPPAMPNEQRPSALATAPPARLLLSFDDLRAAGIRYSRAQLYRLMALGAFPKPIKIDSRNAWIASEIQAWLEVRMAERTSDEAA